MVHVLYHDPFILRCGRGHAAHEPTILQHRFQAPTTISTTELQLATRRTCTNFQSLGKIIRWIEQYGRRLEEPLPPAAPILSERSLNWSAPGDPTISSDLHPTLLYQIYVGNFSCLKFWASFRWGSCSQDAIILKPLARNSRAGD